MEEYIITKMKNGILEFKINRPHKRNAVNYNVIDGLEKVINQINEDDEVKILAITGAGSKAFCSGGDLDDFHHLITAEQAFSMLSRMCKVLYKLAVLDIPTVAVLNGTAVGGGCELAAACDYRIARKGTAMGFIQGRLAITTGWGGGSLLFEKISPTLALKILSESNILDIDSWAKIDFIQKVYDDAESEVLESFSEEILKKDTSVLKAYKKILISKWKQTNLEDRMVEESKQCSLLWEKPAHHHAVSLFRKGK